MANDEFEWNRTIVEMNGPGGPAPFGYIRPAAGHNTCVTVCPRQPVGLEFRLAQRVVNSAANCAVSPDVNQDGGGFGLGASP
jgi:hypothetical protein